MTGEFTHVTMETRVRPDVDHDVEIACLPAVRSTFTFARHAES